MRFLWFTTALWAFSFSFIGVYLAGAVDPYFSVLSRISLAFLLFVPFLRSVRARRVLALKLAGIGAVQLGLMYLFYYHAFLYLTVPEVLVFTIFTPIYVTLVYDLSRRRFSPLYLATAALAVLGAGVLRLDTVSEDFLLGFLVVQGSNLCFAFGQVAYKRVIERQAAPPPQHEIFGCFYAGALVVAFFAWLFLGTPQYPTTTPQWLVLLWLGLAASGGGYFLWNRGASLVNAGALAIMNNALIPAGLVVNLLIWNRDADLTRLVAGSAILFAALGVNEWGRKRRPSTA